jgi:prolipoprotein diacylglyceryltransferase
VKVIGTYEGLVSLAYLSFVTLWFINLSREGALLRGIALIKWLAVAISAGIFAILGGRLLQMLGTANVHDRGSALWGAIMLSYLMIYIELFMFFPKLRRSPRNLDAWVDASIPGLFLAQGIGRGGCLIAHCCYGLSGIPIIETELAFCLLATIYFQFFLKRPTRRPLVLYAYSYGTFRFLAEFYRGDPGRGSAFGLSTSQWASAIAILISAIFLDFAGRTRDKTAL